MLVKYTYPIRGDLLLPEHWPVSWQQYEISWTVEDRIATAVTVTVRTADLLSVPQITPSDRPGVSANFSVGKQPYAEEVQSLLRTVFGLLGLFSGAEIDFGSPAVAWEPENEEERAKLKMHSFKVENGKWPDMPPVGFDLVVRCLMSAADYAECEVPLSFLTKGRRDFRSGRYIDAYYSFFFFLETLFAPGYSNPQKVTAQFRAALEIALAIGEMRQKTALEQTSLQVRELLQLSDDALIDHLVRTRGRLHHHSLGKKSDSWHPERHKEFEAEASIIAKIAQIIATGESIPVLYRESVTSQIQAAASAAGVSYDYLIDAIGGSDRQRSTELPSLRITMPTRAPSHSSLWHLDLHLRSSQGPYENMAVRSYEVKTSDGSEVLARYENKTFPSVNDVNRSRGEGAPRTG